MKSRDVYENAINIADNKDICAILIAFLRPCGSNGRYNAYKVIVLSRSFQNDFVFGK
jgi:hypothetical protein